jgi:hypothetical protein
LVLSCYFAWASPGNPVGDVNGDGTVNVADLVRAGLMVKGEISTDVNTADLTGDGQVTADDLPPLRLLVQGKVPDLLLDRQSIPTSGGSVGTEACSLTVPAGAFSETVTLEVSQLDGLVAFESHAVGNSYEIAGIPAGGNTSLEVSIQVPDEAGDNPMLALGELAMSNEGGFGWHYQLVEATYSNGHLSWQLPAIPAETATRGATRGIWDTYFFRLVVVGGYTQQADPKFKIVYPLNLSESALNPVASALQTAYTLLHDTYGLSAAARTSWPVYVYVKPLSAGTDGLCVSSTWGLNSDYMELNLNLLSNTETCRITAGHEYFHLVQAMYKSTPQDLWLDEAASTWFEKKMSLNSASYIPRGYSQKPRELLKGMHAEPYREYSASLNPRAWITWKTGVAQDRGYGLSVFFEYLSQRPDWNNSFWKTVYEKIRDGSHPVAAITAGTAADFGVCWRDFTRKFPANLIYPLTASGAAQLFYDEKSTGARVTLSSPADLTKSYEYAAEVPQLGGYSLKLSFLKPEILPDQLKMVGELEADSLTDLRLLVFRQSAGSANPELLGESTTTDPEKRRVEITIPNANSNGKFTLMFLAVNDDYSSPYDAKKALKLRAFFAAYPLEPYTASVCPINQSTTPAATCAIAAGLVKGDLGDVTLVEDPLPDIMPGTKLLLIRQASATAGNLLVRLNGTLAEPLTRQITVIDGTWTVSAGEIMGWRVWSASSENSSATTGPTISTKSAWTTGIELPAPPPIGSAIYSLSYNFQMTYTFQNDSGSSTTSTPLTLHVTPLIIYLSGANNQTTTTRGLPELGSLTLPTNRSNANISMTNADKTSQR